MNKLQHLLKAILICLLTFCWSFPAYAVTVENVSNPRTTYSGWVTDQASILGDKTKTHLNKKIGLLEAQTGIELAIVTISETSAALSVKSFTTKLFNYWQIGKVEDNNGILFLVSLKDRRVEIETGSGIEKVISNSKIREIIEQDIEPLFQEKEYDVGVLIAIDDLIAELKSGDQVSIISIPLVLREFLLLWLLLIFAVPIIALIWGIIRAKRKGSSYFAYMSNNYESNSSDYSVSSGSDFDGGSSDGGGDGDSW